MSGPEPNFTRGNCLTILGMAFGSWAIIIGGIWLAVKP
jgi:hypothetical protein